MRCVDEQGRARGGGGGGRDEHVCTLVKKKPKAPAPVFPSLSLFLHAWSCLGAVEVRPMPWPRTRAFACPMIDIKSGAPTMGTPTPPPPRRRGHGHRAHGHSCRGTLVATWESSLGRSWLRKHGLVQGMGGRHTQLKRLWVGKEHAPRAPRHGLPMRTHTTPASVSSHPSFPPHTTGQGTQQVVGSPLCMVVGP